jgi:hypothetical protein
MTTRSEIEVEYDPFGVAWHRYVARFCGDRGLCGYGATPARAIRDLMRAVAAAARQMRFENVGPMAG